MDKKCFTFLNMINFQKCISSLILFSAFNNIQPNCLRCLVCKIGFVCSKSNSFIKNTILYIENCLLSLCYCMEYEGLTHFCDSKARCLHCCKIKTEQNQQLLLHLEYQQTLGLKFSFVLSMDAVSWQKYVWSKQ